MHTKYTIEKIYDNYVSLIKTIETEIDGYKLSSPEERVQYWNNSEDIAKIKIDLPSDMQIRIFEQWGTDDIIIVKKEEITDDLLLAFPSELLKKYDPNGKEYYVGDVFCDDYNKYRVVVPFTSSPTFLPNTISARDFVHPYRSINREMWGHGEVLPYKFMEREYESRIYRNKKPLTSEENRITPDRNSELWEEVKE